MQADSTLTLAENFQRYFAVEFASTPAQLQQVFAMRYRVYCEEFKFEAPEAFPERMESDSYDPIAQHCLVRHRATGIPAGCVRMVPTFSTRQIDPLPFEKYCADSLDEAFINRLALPRAQLCEISRLAVDGRFRQRKGEQLSRFGQPRAFQISAEEQRSFSLISVACFLAATVLTEVSGRCYVFAMMEPFLPRMLQRSGIHFQRAGQDIDYHGKRAAYFVTTQATLAHMYPQLRELYGSIKSSLQESVYTHPKPVNPSTRL